ncbi:hypothetical protein [Fluviispira multicolorata]|uniref:Uncharacterized protein n=1 Tax=Fluviispira multicolorata TaxID=2654512 RepID=A0A833JHX7_9BACT|nr:hypothetical protein [Fluviispira multicolorata]KAB8033602.1 hypothetical protein GCL57_02525 [Fluviispira multicolorata]
MRSRKNLISEANEILSKISKNKREVYFIHYSCESFSDVKDGLSPKIASISILNLESEQTHSFSIHQFAEQEKITDINIIKDNYLNFEIKMLDCYFKYMKKICKNRNTIILHWNMKDSAYGFIALENRFRVLKGKPFSVRDDYKINISNILYNLFGDKYIDKPKLMNIIKYNNYSCNDLMSGEEEAKCFENGDYLKLHNSTLKKVRIFSYIINDLMLKKLKRKSNYFQENGITFETFTNYLTQNSISKFILFIFAIIGFISSFKPIPEILKKFLNWWRITF